MRAGHASPGNGVLSSRRACPGGKNIETWRKEVHLKERHMSLINDI